MSVILLRFGILVVLAAFTWMLVWMGRGFVEARRQRALAAPLPDIFERASGDTSTNATDDPTKVRILAFSSADCRQCKQLQEPALQRVLAARGDIVTLVTVDAPSSPELTERYQVLTLPTTVVLDASGRAHAVNYGFANSTRLLEQIDNVLCVH